MRFLKLFLLAVCLTATVHVHADEGLWMIQNIDKSLETQMKARGLNLSANEIYDAEHPGAAISEAIVSIGFHSTGCVVSSNGLILTNHHSALGNIAKLSSIEHNYIENGFWAMTSLQELPIEGEKVYFLKRVFDVTEEAENLRESLKGDKKSFDNESVDALLVKRYNEATGLECIVNDMWEGEKKFLSVYKVYTDVRLVAAPPLSIGFFGGEKDSRNWPRHNCDFALYRIYENGRPVTSENHLKISTAGYKNGSFAMVIGYPNGTERNAPAARISVEEKYTLPVKKLIRTEQLSITQKWMKEDLDVRLKYSDWFYNLSNLNGQDWGKYLNIKRFNIKGEKTQKEQELQNWIGQATNREEIWGDIIPEINKAYSAAGREQKDKSIFMESLVNGTLIGKYLLLAGKASDIETAKLELIEGIARTDENVEKELLENAARVLFSSLDSHYFGRFHHKMQNRFGKDYKSMINYMWSHSAVTSEVEIKGIESMKDLQKDPLILFVNDCKFASGNQKVEDDWSKATKLEKNFRKAMYWEHLQSDLPQYPDANSTMRISYGGVEGFVPNDGTEFSYATTTEGILQKYDPQEYDFSLNEKELNLLNQRKWRKWGIKASGVGNMPVDFLTNNDIAEGSYGSPVLDGNGHLIGITFDRNAESLASDAYYSKFYNKCVNTDIRFILWVLDRYAGMRRIIKELDFS